MNIKLLILALLLEVIPATLLAEVPTQIFPPVTMQNQECGSDQLRLLSWAKGVSSTVCLTGQQVMSLAIPSCGVDQQVVFDGNQFICRSPTTIPTCTEDQYLSFNGSTYECKTTTIPECATNQVLTSTGSGLVCVDHTDQVPTCEVNQFLTFNGATYQCAASQQVTVPTCPANQFLTGSGGQLSCRDIPTTEATPGTWCGGVAIASYSCLGGETCDHVSYQAIWTNGTYPPAGGSTVLCQGHNPAVSCPAGYMQLQFAFTGWHAQHQADTISVCIKQ